MRICHVIESSSGGSSRVVVELLRDQIAAGHDVTLIYSPIRSEAPFTDAVARPWRAAACPLLPMYRAVGVHDALRPFGCGARCATSDHSTSSMATAPRPGR